MKKMLISFLFSLVAVFACGFAANAGSLSVSATNDFSVSVEKLTAAEVAGTSAGDYKATVYLDNINSDGLSVVSYRLHYDAANFVPVTNSSGTPYYTYGTEITSAMKVVEADDDSTANYVTCGYINTDLQSNLYPDGKLYSIYFRPINNSTDITPVTAIEVLNVRTTVNGQYVNLPYLVSEFCHITAPVQYKVGDANVDGSLQIADATYINRMLANANGVTVTAANYRDYLLSYEEGDLICTFDAIDVNGDGVLTSADSDQIVDYLAGLEEAGALGTYTSVYCVIGTTAPTAA